MSIVSNPAIVMNGGCHSQQFTTTIPASNSANSTGDNTASALHKQISQSASIEVQHNGNDSSIKLNGDYCAENGDSALEAGVVAEEGPCIDIIINNVVCSFSTRCYLNLKKIATEGIHVEYRRENGMLNMKLRRPNVTATIWSSGNITCTGSTSEDEARLSARRIARRLQRLGFNARFCNYRVVNVLGTCSVKFGIKLAQFSEAHMQTASYEPELHPGVTYKIKEPKATLKIFSTGSITVTAPSVNNVQHAIEHIYPLVVPHKMDLPHSKNKLILAERKALKKQGVYVNLPFEDDGEEEDDDEYDDDELECNGVAHSLNDVKDEEDDFSDDFDSDVSHD
ncbi:hypothetical protein EGW08_013919 [Elysia chlorotica]|uniref:TATA box-binding protein-like 1 n=1 Tax=Elysia chlorotica TaxID=188477 RepID=A0A3S1B866_ELYCH|nr:hypothetical protein EGW08_013919 [Elysia chlorotica]